MQYMIGKKKKAHAHYWTGSDTYCRMWGTGGLTKKNYKVSDTDQGRAHCSICRNTEQYGNSFKREPEQIATASYLVYTTFDGIFKRLQRQSAEPAIICEATQIEERLHITPQKLMVVVMTGNGFALLWSDKLNQHILIEREV